MVEINSITFMTRVVSLTIMLIASYSITKVYFRGRKDLKAWVLGYYLYTIGFLLWILGETLENSTIHDLAFIAQELGAVSLLVFVFIKYHSLFRKRDKKRLEDLKKQTNLIFGNANNKKGPGSGTLYSGLMVPFLLKITFDVNDPYSMIVLTALIILIYAVYLLSKIYKVEHTPSIEFITYSMIVSFIMLLASFLSVIGIPGCNYVSDVLDVVIPAFLLTTALVCTHEEKLMRYATGLNEAAKIARESLNKSLELSEELSSTSEELAASAEEVTASSKSISNSQQQISTGASKQVSLITDMRRKFEKFVDDINKGFDMVSSITDITDLVRNIADETEMISLNASIEAARAGEAGKGFNIVATQIRNLADQSKKAVSKVMDMMVEIQHVFDLQKKESQDIISAIQEIVDLAEDASASTEETAAAAEEQVASMENIQNSVMLLNQLAEQMRTLVEEIVKVISSIE